MRRTGDNLIVCRFSIEVLSRVCEFSYEDSVLFCQKSLGILSLSDTKQINFLYCKQHKYAKRSAL